VVVNAGGGRACSLSLLEATALCRELTGREVPVEPAGVARPGDIPIYLSDTTRLSERSHWRPRRTARDILMDIADWVSENERSILSAL
jgi:CDP-paratose 2-epimerase